MVGHTGVIEAAVRGDRNGRRAAWARSWRRCTRAAASCLVTADHGNADHMLEPDGSPNTAHSMNPVPLIVTSAGVAAARRAAGSSPTSRRRVLEVLGIAQPAAMTGASLIEGEIRFPERCEGRPPQLKVASEPSRSRAAARALFFIGAGVNHFVNPRFYEAIVPPA